MQGMWNVKIEFVTVVVRETGIPQNHCENIFKTYLKSKTPRAIENGDSEHCTHNEGITNMRIKIVGRSIIFDKIGRAHV
jgi:hypothetical protein